MMDFVLASVALLVLSPFFLMAALAIIMESRGGAFFSQMRVGKNGKLFRMIKFRTMYPDAEARLASLRQSSDRDAICFKMTDDPRVTRIGGFLRKTSLDEFPQLWNVVRGEMSLVGPRPALPSEVALYTREERERLAGAPGITCLWQISGRADLKFDKQVDLDIAYLRSSSIWLDIAIIVLTPLAMISRRGAY
jgi:lipopolysaccharide/colanic/teichoic acid biosynthesis glycosyltransferase